MSGNDIQAINLRLRFAVTEDGRCCAITNLMDANGEETVDLGEAVTAVVHIADDDWATIVIQDYVPEGLH